MISNDYWLCLTFYNHCVIYSSLIHSLIDSPIHSHIYSPIHSLTVQLSVHSINDWVVVFFVISLSSQAIHHFYGVRNDYPFWLIVVNDDKTKNTSTKYLHLIKLVDTSNKFWIITGLSTPMVMYLLNTTTTEVLTYGLLATFSNFWFALYVSPIILWQVIYYCLIAYRFKLQLQLQNNRLLQLSKRIDRNIVTKVIHCFHNINRINGSIRKFDKFWSTITFIITILLAIVFGVSISQLFGRVETIMRVTLWMIILTIAIVLTTIYISASFIYVEASNTNSVLYKLVNQKRMTRTLNSSFKVILYSS